MNPACGLLALRYLVCLCVIPGGWTWMGGLWRLMGALLLTVLSLPATSDWPDRIPSLQADPLQALPILTHELALGLILGTGLSLLWSGITLVSAFAWSGNQTSAEEDLGSTRVLSSLWVLIALALFFALRADHVLVRQLLRFSQEFPVGAIPTNCHWLSHIVQLLSAGFRFALTVALPFLGANLMVHLVLAFLFRSGPSFAWSGSGPAIQLLAASVSLTILSAGVAWTYGEQLLKFFAACSMPGS